MYIALFFALCLLPALGMAVFGPSPLLANESAPRTPALFSRDGTLNGDVLSDASNYAETRFAFRPQLVSARSFLYEKLLRSSAEPQVVLGKEGELFYASKEIQDSLGARGIRFIFAVAPNKNSLIPGFMPGRFPENLSGSNASRLLPLLQEAGVQSVDLHALLAGRQDLYYRTDSHWTAEGAALAADTLLSALGRDPVFSSGPFAEDGRHVGDLYQMLYPTGSGREAELVYVSGFTYETASDPRGGNAITIRTTSETGTGSLYCLRDSFGIALYPYLAEAFASAEFSRSADYSLAAFEQVDADTVILEIVERNIAQLLPEGESAA